LVHSPTSSANPAVTVARRLTHSFAGIRPIDAVGFITAQLVGVLIALPVLRGLDAGRPRS
jgi:glycerol uptake facilitator-like aquaporin